MVRNELAMFDGERPQSWLPRIATACIDGERVLAPAIPGTQDAVLQFDPVDDGAGDWTSAQYRWHETKARKLTECVTWELLDRLVEFNEDERELLGRVLQAGGGSQVENYGLACLAYYRGDFGTAIRHLIQCLALDPACENFWLLVALACRLSGRHDMFERIVFEMCRDPLLVAPLAEELPC
jgi:hypothetical protein